MLGLWGGVLLKPMLLRAGGWREGENLPPGTLIPGDVTSAWPLPNRMAMASTGVIRYFQSEAEVDSLAAEYMEQAQTAPHHAAHDAAEERRDLDLNRPKPDAFAAARAAKALKALQRQGSTAEA